MSREKIHIEKNTLGENHFAISDGIPRPLTVEINCKKIILKQESIGVEVDVSENFKKVNTIIANGVEFKKQSEGRWLRWGQDASECSLCGKVNTNCSYNNYCPNCGAYMKGGE